MAVKFGFFCGDNNSSVLCAKRKFFDDDDDAALADKFFCHNNNNVICASANDEKNQNVIKYVNATSLDESDQVKNNRFNQCIDYIFLISYAIINIVLDGFIFVRKRYGLFAVFIILLLQLNGLVTESVAANAGTGTNKPTGIISNQCK